METAVRLPKLKLEFGEPQYGYWDGETKRRGEFTIDFSNAFDGRHPGPGYNIRWGYFELNFWFVCNTGLSWKQAVSIARTKLRNMLKVPGTVTIIY